MGRQCIAFIRNPRPIRSARISGHPEILLAIGPCQFDQARIVRDCINTAFGTVGYAFALNRNCKLAIREKRCDHELFALSLTVCRKHRVVRALRPFTAALAAIQVQQSYQRLTVFDFFLALKLLRCYSRCTILRGHSIRVGISAIELIAAQSGRIVFIAASIVIPAVGYTTAAVDSVACFLRGYRAIKTAVLNNGLLSISCIPSISDISRHNACGSASTGCRNSANHDQVFNHSAVANIAEQRLIAVARSRESTDDMSLTVKAALKRYLIFTRCERANGCPCSVIQVNIRC